jgi:hypothetical protein
MSRIALCLALTAFPLAAADAPTEIDFGHAEEHGRFFSGIEIEQWAVSRNLLPLPDCNLRDLADGEAEIISPDGMEFDLKSPGPGRVFVYLDMVVFRPRSSYNPLLDDIHCKAGEDRVEAEPRMVQDVKQVRWMSVEVNGRVLKTVYVGGTTFLRSPLVVAVPREYNGERLKVRLTVSPGEGFFAVWDAFASRSPG